MHELSAEEFKLIIKGFEGLFYIICGISGLLLSVVIFLFITVFKTVSEMRKELSFLSGEHHSNHKGDK